MRFTEQKRHTGFFFHQDPRDPPGTLSDHPDARRGHRLQPPRRGRPCSWPRAAPVRPSTGHTCFPATCPSSRLPPPAPRVRGAEVRPPCLGAPCRLLRRGRAAHFSVSGQTCACHRGRVSASGPPPKALLWFGGGLRGLGSWGDHLRLLRWGQVCWLAFLNTSSRHLIQ